MIQSIETEKYGKKNWKVGEVYFRMAVVSDQMGLSEKARLYYEKAVENFEEHEPPRPWLVTDLLRNYADFLHRQKDYQREKKIRKTLDNS